ncbi:MAG: hypothetical protein V4671_22835 [Armatimonadota bacterium]
MNFLYCYFAIIALTGSLAAAPAGAQAPKPTLGEGSELRALSAIVKKSESISSSAVEFIDCPDFGIELRLGSDATSFKITETDLRAWTEAEIKRAAPKARIISLAQQQDRLDKPKKAPTKAEKLRMEKQRAELKYLIAEGIVKQFMDEKGEMRIRIKTKAEVRAEIKEIEDSY